MVVFFPIKTRRERANDVRKKLIIRHRIDREDGQEEHAAHQGLAREGPRDGQVQEVAQPHRPRHQVGGGVLDVLNRRDVPAVSDLVSAASVAMLPVIDATVGLKKVQARLQTLHDLGLGYLTLGEPTPALSGGEAQRLKLASEMGRVQDDAVFVFDEPTIGLHPLDVQVLLSVFDGLVSKGATVIVIEHDLDLIRNADYVIDMGPGGGDAGGQIVCAGTPADIAACPKSVTGRYL